jgi:hypothetical protein
MINPLPILSLAGMALACSVANGQAIGGVGSSSSSFRDDIWIGGKARGTKTFVPSIWTGPRSCADRIESCVEVIRMNELLTSIAPDPGANTRLDITGHVVSVRGVIITVRAEASPSDPDIATSWSVGGEETLDGVGEHSWASLAPDASPNAKWLPVLSYRFENSSPSALQPQSAIPEPSSWALVGIGFAALGCVGITRLSHL